MLGAFTSFPEEDSDQKKDIPSRERYFCHSRAEITIVLMMSEEWAIRD